MKNLFTYYSGSLDEFIAAARSIIDNHLIKIQLAPSSLPEYLGYSHVLDNFAVHHIMHRHSGNRERLRGQEPGLFYTKDINDYTYSLIEEIRNGHSELATTTLYKKKKKLTDAKSPI